MKSFAWCSNKSQLNVEKNQDNQALGRDLRSLREMMQYIPVRKLDIRAF
jgi:hypothetical protein